MKMILLLLGLGLMGCSDLSKKEEPTSPILPGWNYECHKMTSVDGADFCIHSKGTPEKTIWYFHGLGCNQDILQTAKSCAISKIGLKSDGVSETELMAKLDNVMVVTVSFGEAWLFDPIHPKTRADKDATVKNFMEKMIPEIEGIANLPKPWQAMGHSMGGANLATLVLSEPKLFSKVVLAHPMLIDCDPWAPVVGLKCVGGILFIGAEFTKEKWQVVNPMVRVKAATGLPPIFVQACAKDEFNLVAGPEKFAGIAAARMQPVSVKTYPECSHFAYHVGDILGFLK